MRLNIIGEVAEWSNAAVSKTVVRLTANRGFESPSLRKAKANSAPDRRTILVFRMIEQNLFCEDRAENKNIQFFNEKLNLLWLCKDLQKGLAEGNPPALNFLWLCRILSKGSPKATPLSP